MVFPLTGCEIIRWGIMDEDAFPPAYVYSHRRRMSDKHRREVEAFLRDEAPAALLALPPSSVRTIRTHLVDGLHVLARRNKDGTVSRFLLARLSVNNKTREKGLGRWPDADLFEAWQATIRLHIDAQAERKAAREKNPYWGKRRPPTPTRGRRVTDIEG